jgi:hypothetical protein
MSVASPPPAPAVYSPPVNTLAILALVLSFVVSIGGIVCGHLALSQIKRTGESGRELALAGLIVGYVFTGIGVLAFLFTMVLMFGYLAVFAAIFSSAAAS